MHVKVPYPLHYASAVLCRFLLHTPVLLATIWHYLLRSFKHPTLTPSSCYHYVLAHTPTIRHYQLSRLSDPRKALHQYPNISNDLLIFNTNAL
jgi:hypothetical protein